MILVSEENTEPEVSPEDVSLEDETEETVQTATSERDFADALVGSEPESHPADGLAMDRGDAIGRSGRWLAGWCLRLLVIAAAAWVLGEVASVVWSGILPVVLSIILCTILWPLVRRLRGWHFPPALAVLTTIVGFFVAIGAIFVAIAPSVASQARDLYDRGTEGVEQVLDWIAGPPLNLDTAQLDSFIEQAQEWIKSQASTITETALSGASAATSVIVTLVMVIVLTFFFLKDGDQFLPMVRRVAGRRVGWHLSEVATRCWKTLGGFIRTQAIVSFIDAFFIGLGLVFMSVPLAGPLAIITFFGGFIPIVGAFTAGALAVLIALVANGFTTAVAVLILIIAVQQLEGNILQPVLQSKAMKMHAAVILLSVTVGSGLFGIIGAFLAVPAAAMVTEVLRYLGDLTDLKTGEKSIEEVAFATDTADGPFA
ncbi:AI-2E family transporter [Ancrocorticia populi]|uniref:AI-2E family transporter n=1 Tax=Ancrocorticia populi TaxID=2175228 RepID=A0A2V1K6A6_9ACTO|nr:AI-2E family transporter [Ancrocorticia populi]